jgi:hypothetical protein
MQGTSHSPRDETLVAITNLVLQEWESLAAFAAGIRHGNILLGCFNHVEYKYQPT